MTSSRASAAIELDLPVAGAARRATMILVAMAAACAAWAAWRQGLAAGALGALLVGGTALTIQAKKWTESRRVPRRRLQMSAGGSLHLRHADGALSPFRLRPSARVLGPSVYIDADCDIHGRRVRFSAWLTPLDLLPGERRRWTILLLSGGRVVRS